MTAAVEAHELTRRYGDLVAVDRLTLRVEAGEILGVLGPNGAGKTTAIRMLTTILEPTSGSFSVAAVPQSRPDAIRRLIGVLPESAGYPERQTGLEYVTYHARLHGHSRTSARTTASRLLHDVGLGDRAGSQIGTFSRGMRQRLGIARALVNEPRVVFLDEPTLGLDPAGQRQMLDILRSVARERGATVLLSTHLLGEVEETCTRVVIVNRGRLVADGTVAEVVRKVAAPSTIRLRVDADDAERALAALRHTRGIRAAEHANGSQGSLTATLEPGGDWAATLCVTALADASVTVLAFELEGARLSDAFLAMTGAEAA